MKCDLVVLSSSPPRLPDVSVTPPSVPAQRTFVPSTSSPTSDDLPSLGQLIGHRIRKSDDTHPPAPNALDKRLRLGSRAAPVLERAASGFQTVRDLVETRQLSIEEHNEGHERDEDKPKSRGKTRSPAGGQPKKRGETPVAGKLKRPTKATRVEKSGKALESEAPKDIYDFDAELSEGPVSAPKSKKRANLSGVTAAQEGTQAITSLRLNKMMSNLQAFPYPGSKSKLPEIGKEQGPALAIEEVKKVRGKAPEESDPESKTSKSQLRDLRADPTTKAIKKSATTSRHFRRPRGFDDQRQQEQEHTPVANAAHRPTTELTFIPYDVPLQPIAVNYQKTEFTFIHEDPLQPSHNENPTRPPDKTKERKPKAKATKSTGKSSEHFAGKQAPRKEQPAKSDEKVQTWELLSNSENIPSPRRKVEWTAPPEDSFVNISALEGPDGPNNSDPAVEAARTSFTTLMQDYGYDNPKSPPKADGEPAIEKAPTKRKRLELVQVAAADAHRTTAACENQPTRLGRSPSKKRPKTVTAIALEPYQPPAPELQNDKTVSNLFPSRVKPQSRQVSPTEDLFANEKPKRVTNTVQVKVSKGGKLRKKTAKRNLEPMKPELLSPHALARRMEKQDLLFGTSSQLVREENAAGLRQSQQALRESAVALEPQNQDGLHGSQSSIRKPGRGLWGISAETVDDSVLATELANAQVTPEREEMKANPRPADISSPNTGDTTDPPPPEVSEDAYKAISEFSSSPRLANVVPQVATKHPAASDDASGEYLPTPDVSFEAAARSPTSLIRSGLGFPVAPVKIQAQRQALRALSTNASPQKKPRGPPPKEKAQFCEEVSVVAKEVSTTTEAAAVASSAPQTTLTTKPSETPSTKRPRGRPRKIKSAETLKEAASTKSTVSAEPPPSKDAQQVVSKAATQPPTPNKKERDWRSIDEIEDSEPDATPSPPRRISPAKMPPLRLPTLVSSTSAPPALESMTSGNNATATVKSASHHAWPAVASELFPKITQVVKDAPSPTDSTVLTWHEKILLYDPIVIEDLTAWLNKHDLKIPAKATANGNGDKRKGKANGKGKGKDNEGEANLRPLDPWMVQKWCEENGVCCLWKENLAGGGRNRY